MQRFAKEFAQHFLPGVATNVLPAGSKAWALPAITPKHFKQAKINPWKLELQASHRSYKQSQQRADLFAHLSTLGYSDTIKAELVRRSKAYVRQEISGRKSHTLKFFKGQSHAGHTHWENRRTSIAESE